MHDARYDLGARGWQGVMNYSGCLVPIWAWLRQGPLEDEFYDTMTSPRPGDQVAAEMALFRSGVPWPAVLHSWTLLSSHDAPRPATVIPSRDHRVVAIGMQMTTPGVPMLFAGDEIGLEGAWGEDGRRTMPWDRRDTWDESLMAEYRRLIGAAALVSGARPRRDQVRVRRLRRPRVPARDARRATALPGRASRSRACPARPRRAGRE